MVTVKSEGLGSAKRFGVRYGRRNKLRVAELEKARRDSCKCIYCHKPKVRRVSTGIWLCGKCGAKFTGRAYFVRKKIEIREMEQEKGQEEIEEPEAVNAEEKQEEISPEEGA